MFESYQLKNKANIILVPLQDTKSVTVLVMYPVGSRYEPDRIAGASHFIEHLMFKGTKKRKNTLILTREIDRLGAQYNAFTGKEYTGYYIKTDAKYTNKAMDILSDMLFNSKFDAKEMEREKTVIVEEIRMYNDNPLMNIENIFENLLYQNSLGRDIAGSEKTVLGCGRSELVNFRNKYYEPSNMTIVVAGNVTDKTKDCIEKYFAGEKNKKPTAKIFAHYKFGSGTKNNRFAVQKKPTDQTQLMIGFPGLAYDNKLNPVVSVMNTILGGTMSSRLFIQIRERRGLAYMVRSGSDNFRDTGYVYVRVGLEAKNINEAIKVIKAEINKIKIKGVTKKELADAKTHIRGAITLSLEDSSTQANWYASQALFMKEIKTPEDKLNEIDWVSNEQIKALAKKIFKMNKMRVAVIGDVDENKIIF